jgi:hypothetical protein
MAGAFEQPLFFSTAMITTSSRLQHLDSHFSLHARLSGCRQAASRPHIDRIHSSPPQLLSPPVKNVKRSTSRSSTTSDAASFYTAVSNAEEGDAREEKTASGSHREAGAVVVRNGQPEVTSRSEANMQKHTAGGPKPPMARMPVIEPLTSLPEQPYNGSRKESGHRAVDRRRTSTVSEPLPRSSIPRRTSSKVHRRQRKGQDLISFHRDSCRLFQSLEGTLSANCEDSRPVLSRHYSMPGSRSTSFHQHMLAAVIQQPTQCAEAQLKDEASADDGKEIPERLASTVSLPVSVEIEETACPMSPTAATMMSWTTAATRKREYEKIDQAHSGFRGLWKKLTPKWCHGRNSRRKFFEGKCDGDSVRRYRVEMPNKFDSGDGILPPQKAS